MTIIIGTNGCDEVLSESTRSRCVYIMKILIKKKDCKVNKTSNKRRKETIIIYFDFANFSGKQTNTINNNTTCAKQSVRRHHFSGVK